MEQALVNAEFLLEKYPGKGGWTYALIPQISIPKNKKFGWVKVRGSVDDFEFKKQSLMPMGNGFLFLSVRAEIRKKINKQAGDTVRIILYPDNEPIDVPEEFLLCLHEEPKALAFFNSLTEGEQKFYIQWIYSAKKEETKIDRMAESINRLYKGLKLYQKPE